MVAVTLYLLDNWRVGPAVDYLEKIAPGCPGLVEAVETWAICVPWEVLDRMRDEGLAPRGTVYRKASDFYVKWRLTRWTEGQNDTAGLAPPTAEVLRQHDRIAYATGAAVGGRQDSSQTKNRMWATRWRKTHGVALGTPQVADDVPLAERRQKVRCSTCVYGPLRAPPAVLPPPLPSAAPPSKAQCWASSAARLCGPPL